MRFPSPLLWNKEFEMCRLQRALFFCIRGFPQMLGSKVPWCLSLKARSSRKPNFDSENQQKTKIVSKLVFSPTCCSLKISSYSQWTKFTGLFTLSCLSVWPVCCILSGLSVPPKENNTKRSCGYVWLYGGFLGSKNFSSFAENEGGRKYFPKFEAHWVSGDHYYHWCFSSNTKHLQWDREPHGECHITGRTPLTICATKQPGTFAVFGHIFLHTPSWLEQANWNNMISMKSLSVLNHLSFQTKGKGWSWKMASMALCGDFACLSVIEIVSWNFYA